MNSALLTREEAMHALFGKINSSGYKQLRKLHNSGELKILANKWIPRSEIKRLSGDLDDR